MSLVTNSPPRPPPIRYEAQHGTRWQKEKASAGEGAFEYANDPRLIGPWIIGECVGKGASGRVKIAKHRYTGQLAAVKILPLQPLVNSRASLATQQAKTDKQRLGVDREITMMKLMNHPNIIRIYDVYEGDNELYLILEYVEGGELFDFLVNRGKLPSLEALAFFKQIVFGLNYAHTFSIIHRDLKPENILIHSLNPPLIKIADWGMAAFAPPALQLETSCGSPHYASPEIVGGDKYEGSATDVWSCGVILYALLTGRLPFDDKNVRTLLSKVKVGKYEMPPYIDPQAKDLLSRMLVVDVAQRMTISEILAHSWLQNITPGIIYVPAPSVSELARPLRSAAHIDRDILESLLVIWGRHADLDTIKADLLSPAGEGTLAKVFYFLLYKYRERTLAEHGFVMDLGPSSLDGCDKRKVITKQYTSPHTPSTQLAIVTHSRGHIRSPRNVLPPDASRSRSPSSAQIPRLVPPLTKTGSRVRPTSPCGPRPPKPRPQSSPVSCPSPEKPSQLHISTQALPLFENKTRSSRSPSPSRPSSKLEYVNMDTPPRHQRPIFLQHSSFTESPQQISSVIFPVISPHPSSANPNAGERKGTTIPPLSLPVVPVNTHIHAPTPLKPITALAPIPLLTAPRTDNPAVQRAIDDITERVNVLVVRGNAEQMSQSTGYPLDHLSRQHGHWNRDRLARMADAHGHSGRATTAPLHPLGDLHRDRIGSFSADDKENRAEEGAGHVFVDPLRKPEGLGLSKSTDQGKQTLDGAYAVGNNVRREGPMKERKERKGRPTTLNLQQPLLNTKRSTLSGLTSPTLNSPPPLLSPVVGEFKGWFSNLFNWKAQSYILYSPDDILTTRSETIRLLEQFGVIVVLEEVDGGYRAPLLRCLAEDGVDLMTGAITHKRTSFRVEFIPGGGGAARQHGFSAPHHSHDAFSSPSSARTSVLLGRNMVKMPGYLCAIVLIQEKGSMSTFRGLARRLKEEWRLESGLQSPVVGSGGGQATPLMENVRQFTS